MGMVVFRGPFCPAGTTQVTLNACGCKGIVPKNAPKHSGLKGIILIYPEIVCCNGIYTKKMKMDGGLLMCLFQDDSQVQNLRFLGSTRGILTDTSNPHPHVFKAPETPFVCRKDSRIFFQTIRYNMGPVSSYK